MTLPSLDASRQGLPAAAVDFKKEYEPYHDGYGKGDAVKLKAVSKKNLFLQGGCRPPVQHYQQEITGNGGQRSEEIPRIAQVFIPQSPPG
jgi:hypothetical protein